MLIVLAYVISTVTSRTINPVEVNDHFVMYYSLIYLDGFPFDAEILHRVIYLLIISGIQCDGVIKLHVPFCSLLYSHISMA